MKLIIFDLDGTLVDSLADLADSANYTMSQMGYPSHPVESFRYFVGNGVPKLLERCLPEGKRTEENIAAARGIFSGYYNVHYADKTRPYEGIIELLDALKRNGIKTAVATNKSEEFARSIVDGFFGDRITTVRGGKEGVPKKPSPDIVFGIMEDLGAVPENTYFAGDSDVDMYTAKNAGIRSIGCLWGFRTREELINGGACRLAEKPADILGFLEE